ncbi:hypothetical protein AB1M95_12075 [Sulfitobacter sp. LCG007]
MKPTFALSLSVNGIRLLHRAAGGWRVVGEAEPAGNDLDAQLAALRNAAEALDPAAPGCKLLIPNDQIRYISIDTPGLGHDARREAALRAFDGATPYAVEQLAFDISADGDATHVAAVARETLEEAEAFAAEHGFDPLGFAAVPGDQPFLGEPWFGASRRAATLLPPGETVEPDGVAVVEIGGVQGQETPDMSDASRSDSPKADVPMREGPKATRPKDSILAQPDGTAADRRMSPSVAARNGEDPGASRIRRVGPSADDQEDMAAPSPAIYEDAFIEAADQGFAEPPVAPLVAERSGGTGAPGFTSRRAPGATRGSAGTTTAAGNGPQIARTDPVLSGVGARANGAAAETAGAEPPNPTAPAKPGFASRRAPERVEPVTARRSETIATAIPADPARPEGGEGMRIGPRTAGQARAALHQSVEPAPERQRGKPRYLGLILTAILLAVLLAVAAWASVRLDEGLAGLFDRQRDSDPAELAVSEPTLDPQPAAGGDETASLESHLTEEDTAVLEALRRQDVQPPSDDTDPAVDPIALPMQEGATTPEGIEPIAIGDRLEAEYAVSGIWPVTPDLPAPGLPVPIEDLYMTGIDPVSLVEDAVALPDASADTDLALAAQSSPVAAQARFELDARGLVIPTAAGVVNPDGVVVYLGRPARVPPAVMARAEPAPVSDALEAALALRRPVLRPTTLLESNERANYDGLTRSELAALRPQLRPVSTQDNALAAASLVPLDAPAQEATQTDPYATATRLAAPVSIRPGERPDGFASLVDSTRARSQVQAETREQVEAEAAADQQEAPVRQAAAVVPRNVTPNIPSSATVSRSATVKNAISLRETSLIGVYGKPSARRALIRLSNGRYQKVKVGDRIDGGRVSAIGDNELMYRKGSRNVVLRMPKT